MQGLPDCSALDASADEGRSLERIPWCGALGCRDDPDVVEKGVLAKDRRLEVSELATGVESELIIELTLGGRRHGERICLPPAPVQRQHQLRRETLSKRMLRHDGLDLAHDLSVAPRGQLAVEVELPRLETELVQPGCDRRSEVGSLAIRQDVSTPQVECVSQHCAGLVVTPESSQLLAVRDPGLEDLEIQELRVDDEAVATSLADQLASSVRQVQRPTNVPDIGAQRDAGAVGRSFSPQAVDQPLHRQRLVVLDEEDGEEVSSLRAPHGHVLTLRVADPHRAQHVEPGCHPVTLIDPNAAALGITAATRSRRSEVADDLRASPLLSTGALDGRVPGRPAPQRLLNRAA
ncbi:MAG TPA: hypothetical protein VFY76_05870 [Nocardioides sp.]|nr:hypothetical protein [Nocardioides sp.]